MEFPFSWKATGSATTTYASKLYNTDGTPTKHVFTSMGDLVATIVGTTASTTATTTYIHTDHLGGTAATTNVDGDILELSDFHPYGSPRISLNYTGSTEQRKYAGTERDDSLDYMNARYYEANRGQFLSEDPVFWEIGQTRDGKAALLNPQSQNSYSYAGDNPITNKDPLGRYLELSGSLVVPGRAWSAGIRFDSNGIDYFLSGGAGAGLAAGFEAMWAPGVMLSHTNQASVSVNGTVADGVGGRMSQNVWTYDPITKKTIPNGDPVLGLVFGAGGGASVQFEGSAPIPGLVWNKPIAPSTLGSTANIPTSIMSYSTWMNSVSTPSQYVVQNNTTYARTSGGGLSPTSLPATVSQGGSTYYRNSSGLLSTKPGQ